MSNCSNHKKDLFGETDMKKVAEAIGDMHYEAFAELLHELDLKVTNDSIRDRADSKTDLSCALWDAAIELNGAAHFIKKAWQISKPFMDTGDKVNN